jgi:putative ATPase
MADLFASDAEMPGEPAENAPLADRLRPRTLSDVVGQDHLTGPEGAIGRMVAAGRLSSIILWHRQDDHRSLAGGRGGHAL